MKHVEACPVCLVTEAMIVTRDGGKRWACRGCGSAGTYIGTERVVTGAAQPFDYSNQRGERAGIVKQLRKDWRKIRRESAA